MEEENVNDFTQSPIPQGAVSLSEGILPGLFSGMSQIAQGQANLRALEEKKKREISTIASEFDPEDVWEVDQEELMRLAEKKSDEFTKAAGAPGVDLDNLQYGALADVVRAGKKELTRATTKAQENQKGYNKVLEDYNLQLGKGNNAAFDTAHMKDWLDRFKAKGSIEERNAMLNNPQDTPYVRNYNELDLATFTKPAYSTDPATGMRYMDEEIWGNRIYTYITGQDGAGYYDKYKQAGESPEAFADRMAQKFGEDTQLVPDIYRYNRPRQTTGGGSKTSKNYGFTPNIEKATGPEYSPTKVKNILYLKTPKGLPPSSKAGVVRQRVDPSTGATTPITEQITVNSIYYNKDNVLTVSIIRYDKDGKQIGSGENVPYLENKTDYDNFAGFDLGKRLDDEIAAEEAKSSKSGGATKPAAKSSGQASGKKQSIADQMRQNAGKK